MSGDGQPTVVLVNGLAAWTQVRLGIEPGVTRAAHVHSGCPPYILVGQSFGGALVRIYADTFPEGVAGLVLVDPFQEAFFEDWLKVKQPKNYQLFKESAGKYVSDWDGLIGSLRKTQPPATLPVVLLTAGQRQIRKNDTSRAKDPARGFRASLMGNQGSSSEMDFQGGQRQTHDRSRRRT